MHVPPEICKAEQFRAEARASRTHLQVIRTFPNNWSWWRDCLFAKDRQDPARQKRKLRPLAWGPALTLDCCLPMPGAFCRRLLRPCGRCRSCLFCKRSPALCPWRQLHCVRSIKCQSPLAAEEGPVAHRQLWRVIHVYGKHGDGHETTWQATPDLTGSHLSTQNHCKISRNMLQPLGKGANLCNAARPGPPACRSNLCSPQFVRFHPGYP